MKVERMANQASKRTDRLYEELMGRIAKWAEACPDIRAAVIIGSWARVDHPADEWSDLDVIVVTTDPERYMSSTDWLESFGKPLLTFLEPTATGGQMERRVLFEGMVDVDFSIIPRGFVEHLLRNKVQPQIAEVFRRGYRVLVDKDGMAPRLIEHLSAAQPPSLAPPGRREFLELIHDFLFHAVWTVKKLRRGEVWTAKFCLDSSMKWRCLLRMLEWHARATRGWSHDTWHNGRFLEEWADPHVLMGLRGTFVGYGVAEIRQGLLATMDLFRKVAMETAERIGYSYPRELDDHVTEWIKRHLSELGPCRDA